MTAEKFVWLIYIGTLSGLCVLAHVISLIGWPKHVKSSLSVARIANHSPEHSGSETTELGSAAGL